MTSATFLRMAAAFGMAALVLVPCGANRRLLQEGPDALSADTLGTSAGSMLRTADTSAFPADVDESINAGDDIQGFSDGSGAAGASAVALPSADLLSAALAESATSSMLAAGVEARRLQGSIPVLNGAFFLNGPANTQQNADGSVSISLTRSGGSGFTSSRAYTFGSFSVDAKLPGGYSAGVCSTFFLINGDYSSRGEWDFEFLGSASDGSGMTLQTNYWQNGVGGHEVLAPFGFDPSAAFHNYRIDWHPDQTTWFVDGTAIRSVQKVDVNYPQTPMTVALSIWDASEWATGPRDGRIPVDYKNAPFTATFKNFQYSALSGS